MDVGKPNQARLLTEKEAAQMLSLSVKTLQLNRQRHTGVSYVKIGKAVRYKQDDIQRYIEANRISL